MIAVILNNGSFVLTDGVAPYFIAKEDFLNFLSNKQALREFIEKTPIDKRSISPIGQSVSIQLPEENALTNNYERLGFYEYYGS